MPIGPYEDFEECVDAQREKGESRLSARRICGAMERDAASFVAQEDDQEAFDECVRAQQEKGESRSRARRICKDAMEERQAQALTTNSVEKFTNERGKLFVKAFLIDASINRNDWAVTPDSIPKHINTFIGKPLVLTKDYDHPGTNIDSLSHWLKFQEDYRVGNIIDITQRKNPQTGSNAYYAIIEVTDKHLKDSLQNNSVPHYVSPAIAQPAFATSAAAAAATADQAISEWTGIHLALVDEPAYGVKKATITETCGGDREGCLLQLRKANIARFGLGNVCGFCRKEALKTYRLRTARFIMNTSHAQKTSPISKKLMSSLEPMDSTNNSNPSQDNKVERVEEPNTINNKQPVTIPPSNTPTNIRELLERQSQLLHEIELRDLKIQELTDAHSTVQERIAALELRDRRKDIERIITPDIIKDDKARLEKIKQLTSSSIPVQEIEALYKDLKVVIKKAALNNGARSAGGARVPYLSSGSIGAGSASNNMTIVDTMPDEEGLTSLQKQLKILRGGF